LPTGSPPGWKHSVREFCARLSTASSLSIQREWMTVRPDSDDDISTALQAAGALHGVVFVHGANAKLDGRGPDRHAGAAPHACG